MTHIIDTLIEERATRLMRHRTLWALLRRGIHPLLLYDTARAMADTIAPLTGDGAMDYLRTTLAMDVKVTGLDHIPPRAWPWSHPTILRGLPTASPSTKR